MASNRKLLRLLSQLTTNDSSTGISKNELPSDGSLDPSDFLHDEAQ